MNKGITITFIIILSVIAISLTGGFIYLISNNFEFGAYTSIFNSYSNNIIESNTYENLDEINIDSKAIDIFIEETDETTIKVELYSEKEMNHEFKLDNNSLNIIAYKENNLFGLFNKGSRLVIKLPKNYNNKLNIDSKVGDIHIGSFENLKPIIKNTTGDIKITKVDESTIELTTGDVKVTNANKLYIKKVTGDIKIENIDTLEVDSKTGDIKIENITNKLNITNTTGDIKIEYANIKENSNISNKTGDIKIKLLEGSYIEATNNIGDIKVNNNDRKLDITTTIHTNTGDIRVN